jgi:hypothetical protein
MNSFQIEHMLPQQSYNRYPVAEEEPLTPPKAPKLRAHRAPSDLEQLQLPLSRDEFMSHSMHSQAIPSTTDLNIHNNSLIL